MIQSKRIPYYWHQTVKSMYMPHYSGDYQNQAANRNRTTGLWQSAHARAMYKKWCLDKGWYKAAA